MRTPLTRERVVDAGVALADAQGLEYVSMRRLGEALGVESMSLYRHVGGKDDLVRSMAEQIVGLFPLPETSRHWRDALRRNAIHVHQILRAHSWASALLASRDFVGPQRLTYLDAVLDRLRVGGLSVRAAHFAMHAFDSHVMSFLDTNGREDEDADAGPEVAALRAGELATRYPRIAESMAESVHDHALEFEFILDILLDGFVRAAQQN